MAVTSRPRANWVKARRFAWFCRLSHKRNSKNFDQLNRPRQSRRMTKLPKILGLTVALGLSASASAQMMINGAGATFPYPIYSKWFDEYAKVDPSVRFNYQSIGSGGGQKQILAQTVDFGASDGPM